MFLVDKGAAISELSAAAFIALMGTPTQSRHGQRVGPVTTDFQQSLNVHTGEGWVI